MKIKAAEFVKSAKAPADYPVEGWPEAAFAGRSNVGKSSLINALTNRKKLARVSGAPGHTRLLNFFRINDCYSLVDLPGYGYAKVSRGERAEWQRMVETYLRIRAELRAVVLILDLRRPPGSEERELIAFLTHEGIPPVLVATKADKVSPSRRAAALKDLAAALGAPPGQVVLFSAETGEGRDALWGKLEGLLT